MIYSRKEFIKLLNEKDFVIFSVYRFQTKRTAISIYKCKELLEKDEKYKILDLILDNTNIDYTVKFITFKELLEEKI